MAFVSQREQVPRDFEGLSRWEDKRYAASTLARSRLREVLAKEAIDSSLVGGGLILNVPHRGETCPFVFLMRIVVFDFVGDRVRTAYPAEQALPV